jgi:hypothetical protein
MTINFRKALESSVRGCFSVLFLNHDVAVALGAPTLVARLALRAEYLRGRFDPQTLTVMERRLNQYADRLSVLEEQGLLQLEEILLKAAMTIETVEDLSRFVEDVEVFGRLVRMDIHTINGWWRGEDMGTSQIYEAFLKDIKDLVNRGSWEHGDVKEITEMIIGGFTPRSVQYGGEA